MADVCVVTTDFAEGAYVAQALSLVGKRGRVVMTAIAHPTETQVEMSLLDLTLFEKQVRGSLFGSSNPRADIFKLLSLYDSGQLKLDELITREYTLEDINQGYDDMFSGVTCAVSSATTRAVEALKLAPSRRTPTMYRPMLGLVTRSAVPERSSNPCPSSPSRA